MPKTLVFIPTYNERDNVEGIAAQILAQGLDADLLFMDDNSPDGTGEVLDRLAAKDSRVRVTHRTGKFGVGSAHLEGIRWAYAQGYELLVTMDCDFTHSPADMGRMIAALANHDIAVGSRYLQPGSLRGWNPLRSFLTNLGHVLTRYLLGMEYDATGAYRVYRLSTIPQAEFDLVASTGYALFFESLFVLHRNGCTIAQIPIVLPPRTYGNSKMSFLEPYRSLRRIVSLFLSSTLEPGAFRLARAPIERDPLLGDPQGWDSYWEKKQKGSPLAYEVVASLYQRLIIRRRIEAVLRFNFPPGSRLLHAGCGNGQVDTSLQEDMKLTALDISVLALRLYSRNIPKAVAVRHGSVLDLPFEDASFDGVYSLGVLDHFAAGEIQRVVAEFGRVLRPGGKLVLFWPHVKATTAWLLGRVQWMLNDVLGNDVQMHPAEISLVRSRSHAEAVMREAGLDLVQYRFGPRDGLVQAVIVARKPGTAAGTP